jgi:hypothetical protein
MIASRIFVTAVGVVVAMFAPLAVADGPDVYTAIKQEALFTILNIRLERIAGVSYPGVGVAYIVDSSSLGVRIKSVNLAVHPSREAAEEAVRRYCRSSQVGPRLSSHFATVGDMRFAWDRGAEAGAIIFLRENASVAFFWTGTKDNALAVAHRIDELIQTDRTVAPRGGFAQVPEIPSTGAPNTIDAGARVTIQPDVIGFGDPAKTRIRVLNGGLVVSETDESRRLCLRPHSLRPGPVRLIMVASNEDNVVVAREFTVQVTE